MDPEIRQLETRLDQEVKKINESISSLAKVTSDNWSLTFYDKRSLVSSQSKVINCMRSVKSMRINETISSASQCDRFNEDITYTTYHQPLIDDKLDKDRRMNEAISPASQR